MEVLYSDAFKAQLRKASRQTLRRIMKAIRKIAADPSVGKPLRYSLKGHRSLRFGSHRLIYLAEPDRVLLLRYDNRDEAYS